MFWSVSGSICLLLVYRHYELSDTTSMPFLVVSESSQNIATRLNCKASETTHYNCFSIEFDTQRLAFVKHDDIDIVRPLKLCKASYAASECAFFLVDVVQTVCFIF